MFVCVWSDWTLQHRSLGDYPTPVITARVETEASQAKSTLLSAVVVSYTFTRLFICQPRLGPVCIDLVGVSSPLMSVSVTFNYQALCCNTRTTRTQLLDMQIWLVYYESESESLSHVVWNSCGMECEPAACGAAKSNCRAAPRWRSGCDVQHVGFRQMLPSINSRTFRFSRVRSFAFLLHLHLVVLYLNYLPLVSACVRLAGVYVRVTAWKTQSWHHTFEVESKMKAEIKYSSAIRF